MDNGEKLPIVQLPKGEFKTSVVLENVHYGDNGHAMVWAETIYNKSGAGNGPRIEVAWGPAGRWRPGTASWT